MLYTSKRVREEVLAAMSELRGYPLWLARYAPEPPIVPQSWETWTFWQFSDGVTNAPPPPSPRPGPSRNRFNGTEADLRRFAGLSD